MKKYRSEKAGENIIRTYDALLRQWGVTYDEVDVHSGYGDTHAIIAGEKSAPPLVLFHGVGDDSALMWLYNAATLARDYRVYAIDTIGGPGKSNPGPGYDKDFDDVKWIDETLDGLNLGVVSIMGVSHGGYLAQLYALKRPERVDKAICVSSAVARGEGGSPMKTMLRIFMPEALFPTDKNVKRLLEKLSGAHPEAFTGDPLIMEHYKWLLKGFNNMSMAYHKVTGFSDAEIDAIRGKAYFLVGDRDPFQLLGGKKALLDCRMNVRFYPDAGHGLNHERADDINKIAREILQGSVTDIRQ